MCPMSWGFFISRFCCKTAYRTADTKCQAAPGGTTNFILSLVGLGDPMESSCLVSSRADAAGHIMSQLMGDKI